MAARAPSGPTQYIDKKKVVPGEQIVATEIDQVVEDQHWAVLRKQQLIWDWFGPIGIFSAAYQEIARYRVAFDLCSSATGGNSYFCVYGVASAVGNFEYRLRETASGWFGIITVTASHTTPLWRGWGQCNLYVDGTENEFVLEGRYTSGTPSIVTAGFGLVTA